MLKSLKLNGRISMDWSCWDCILLHGNALFNSAVICVFALLRIVRDGSTIRQFCVEWRPNCKFAVAVKFQGFDFKRS